MSRAGRTFGIWAERVAARRLEDEGYRVLEANYRCREGEIDLVAVDGNALVFVEVKARRGTGYGAPSAAVDSAKQRKLARAAIHYLAERRPRAASLRFDVVTVLVDGASAEPRIDLIRGAFDIG
jgi:putative endonuclease